MIGLTLILCSLVLLCFVAIKRYNYWSKRKIKTNKFVPVFGDYYRMILAKESISEMLIRIYKDIGDVRYFGSYQFLLPALILKSPELVKQVCVKHFDHFMNHRNVISDGADELWTKNLVTLKGEDWKNMRLILSPSFTSSKIKAMFVHMSQNARLFTQHFLQMNEETVEVELKDSFTRYATDVIANAAFGIQVDSLKDRDNEFYVMAKEGSNFSNPWGIFVFMAYQICPTIASFFGLRLFGEKTQSFFFNVVKDTIKLREDQNIKRSDMLGLLMEARKGKHIEEKEETAEANFAAVGEYLEMKNAETELSDKDIACQVFVFFLGGFQSVSAATCFMAHELAVNPDIQKKLIEEIDRNKTDNDVSYQTIVSMTYLDMVVSESLRKWPVGTFTDRVVTKPYTIESELMDEETLTLEVGDYVIIPILAFHYDPKYFADPEKFIPERFSPENRKNIHPYTYLPFGVGPRNCIGSRFALLEMKALFFHLLSHFEIVPIQETNIPLKIKKSSFTLKSVNGFPLGLRKRN